MKRKSFSLVEVIVGVVILALTFGGLTAAFIGARAYISHADQRLVSINLARKFLDDLYDGVGADKWDDVNEELGIQNNKQINGGNPYVVDGFEFDNNTYDVTNDPTYGYRQATVNIDLSGDGGPGWY